MTMTTEEKAEAHKAIAYIRERRAQPKGRRGIPAAAREDMERRTGCSLFFLELLAGTADAVVVRGLYYRTFKSACDDYGVHGNQVREKMRAGMPPGEAILATQYNQQNNGKPVTVNGVDYRSIRAALRANGFSDVAGSERHMSRELGISVPEAIERMIQDRDEKASKYVYDGRAFSSHTALCEHAGVPEYQWFKFHKEGMTPDEVIARIEERREWSDAVAWGPYSSVLFCAHCKRAYRRKKPFNPAAMYETAQGKLAGSQGGCSKRCREKILQETKRRAKKRRGNDNHRRRARKNGAEYDPQITTASVALRDGMKCQMCGIRVEKHRGEGYQPRGWSIGHIRALSDGGDHTWDNVQCECIDCNVGKGTEAVGALAPAMAALRKQTAEDWLVDEDTWDDV